MDFEAVLKARRSIRKYALTKKGEAEKISLRQILEAVDAARYAPMAGGIFSLKIIVVDDVEKIKKIADYADQEFIADAPAVIIVCSKEDKTKIAYGERAERYLRQQAGAAIQNILLNITDLGLSSCWIGYFDDKKIKEVLEIPNDIFIEALLPVAKPWPKLKLKEKKLIDLRNILYWNKWKGKHEKAEKEY